MMLFSTFIYAKKYSDPLLLSTYQLDKTKYLLIANYFTGIAGIYFVNTVNCCLCWYQICTKKLLPPCTSYSNLIAENSRQNATTETKFDSRDDKRQTAIGTLHTNDWRMGSQLRLRIVLFITCVFNSLLSVRPNTPFTLF